jgi:dimethylhistidine N-methyltransferase
MIDRCTSPLTLVELGSGTATKTRHLIGACLETQPQLEYFPIDISSAALEEAGRRLLTGFPQLRVTALVGDFSAGLNHLAKLQGDPRLVLFLGSTIGNFDENELDDFFAMLRSQLRPIDRFLLGFDLLKPASVLIPAYNDLQGVTAQFNLNLLVRMNREFAADFNVSTYKHRAVFNECRSRIEMYLVSQRRQKVHIPGLEMELTFNEGETIHTENSYKHSRKSMEEMLKLHGFTIITAYTDPRAMFCLLLAS